MRKLKNNRKVKLAAEAVGHSDQGFHDYNPLFQKPVKKFGFGHSISRRGNCWDNAPHESFFVPFKLIIH